MGWLSIVKSFKFNLNELFSEWPSTSCYSRCVYFAFIVRIFTFNCIYIYIIISWLCTWIYIFLIIYLTTYVLRIGYSILSSLNLGWLSHEALHRKKILAIKPYLEVLGRDFLTNYSGALFDITTEYTRYAY